MQVRVFVIMEGGVIQNVLADDPDVVDVVVVDYDTDGVPLEETTMTPQDDASGKGATDGYERAIVSYWASEAIPWVGDLLRHKAVKMFGEGG